MRWGLDAAYAPHGYNIDAQRALGWSFYCGYIGGAADNVWTQQEWRDVGAAGFLLLPIWVAPLKSDPGWARGVDEGNACVATMQALGFRGTVALDIEDGGTPVEYAYGFESACAAGQVGTVLYGNQKTLEVVGEGNWLAWWLAFWPARPEKLLGVPPDWSMWQYAEGNTADFNVCVDAFPFALLLSPAAPSAPPSAEA